MTRNNKSSIQSTSEALPRTAGRQEMLAIQVKHRQFRLLNPILPAIAMFSAVAGVARAENVFVPNGSFESPATSFVDTRIDSWQKTPKPVWWDENAYGAWDNLSGVFSNVPPADARHIVNCDGNQAIFLFSNPEVGLFQDYDSTDWANPTPTHAFDARFETGKAYQLTAGVLVGTAYPMVEGATLQLSLYYRDAAGNQVTVAATMATNLPSIFPGERRLVDFHVQLPPVQAGHAWAGEHIGVSILSTAQGGGIWEIDNVRLTAIRAPRLVGATAIDGQFGFTLEGEPGKAFEILASGDPGLPLPQWTSAGFVTNTSGTVSFTEPMSGGLLRFYGARQLP